MENFSSKTTITERIFQINEWGSEEHREKKWKPAKKHEQNYHNISSIRFLCHFFPSRFLLQLFINYRKKEIKLAHNENYGWRSSLSLFLPRSSSDAAFLVSNFVFTAWMWVATQLFVIWIWFWSQRSIHLICGNGQVYAWYSHIFRIENNDNNNSAANKKPVLSCWCSDTTSWLM